MSVYFKVIICLTVSLQFFQTCLAVPMKTVSDSIDFTIVIQTMYFLDQLVEGDGSEDEYSMLYWNEVILFDTLQNKLQESGSWSKRNTNALFKNIPKQNKYYLQYINYENKIIKYTINLSDIKDGKMIIIMNESVSKRLLLAAKSLPFIIESLAVGDIMKIKLNSYPLGNQTIEVTRKSDRYTATLDVLRGKREPLKNDSLSSKELEMLKAFELDSRRKFRNTCHDLEQRYKLCLNDLVHRSFNNDCGIWDGYLLLRKGLFGGE